MQSSSELGHWSALGFRSRSKSVSTSRCPDPNSMQVQVKRPAAHSQVLMDSSSFLSC